MELRRYAKWKGLFDDEDARVDMREMLAEFGELEKALAEKDADLNRARGALDIAVHEGMAWKEKAEAAERERYELRRAVESFAKALEDRCLNSGTPYECGLQNQAYYCARSLRMMLADLERKGGG
jgi:uncharacterized membrane protein YccC